MSLTKTTYSMIAGAPANVLDFGADPTGATDSSAAFQAALDAAKGANGTGVGRSVFRIYVPSIENGFFRIENTLIIDGTHGLVIYGDGALTQRNNQNATIRWYGAGGEPIFNVRGQTGTPSNPNFMITFRDLTMNGYQSSDISYTTSLPSNYALAGIYIGALDGNPDDTLLRGAIIENCMISNCRFGIYSGSPTGLNTDHAIVDIKDCNLFNHTQAGIWWGTGNAIATVSNCSIDGCGWTNDQTNASDVYATSRGANIYLDSGSMDIYNYVGSGAGSSKPKSADIYQQSGRISIINSWSDTHGLFFQQSSASQIAGTQYQVAQITGIRHWEGSMTGVNTPDSVDVSAPGTSIVSCSFYGNVRLTSGLGGRPICMGINFGRAGATFVGTGVETQRSLIHHGNKGNFAQSFYGGFNAGRDQFNTVDTGPTHFVMKGDNPGIMEVANGGPAGTNMVWLSQTADANGPQAIWYTNCYYEVAAGGWVPLQNDKACWLLTYGGTNGFRLQVADPNGVSTALSFVDVGGWLSAPQSGNRDEVTLQPPQLAADPAFSSGDYWKGTIYYNTATNKLRLNTGGSTWVDLN